MMLVAIASGRYLGIHNGAARGDALFFKESVSPAHLG